MYDLDDEIGELEPEEYEDEDIYDPTNEDEDEETLEELDIDERGHVVPRRNRRRRDEEPEFPDFDE